MKKFWYIIAFIATAILGSVFYFFRGNNSLDEEIKDNREAIKDVQEQVSKVEEDKKVTEEQIEETEKRIEETQEQIQDTQDVRGVIERFKDRYRK